MLAPIKMYKESLLACFLAVLMGHLAHGQTNELDYFYHPQYFNDSLIAAKKVKQITVTSYWTRPKEKMYLDNRTVYSYNQEGDLLCTEAYSFKPHDLKTITLQTIDCNEYSDGLQSRHLRYHDDLDSAEWIQEFDYECDGRGNIAKITVDDLSHPHHSYISEHIYDEKNRLIRSKTDFGHLTEYIYDNNGNLIERNSGPRDGIRSQNCYLYDDEGNLINYKITGAPLDNYTSIEEVNKYDEQNRIIFQETIYTSDEKTYTKYYYPEKSIVKSEYLRANGEVISMTTEQFSDGLIQSTVTQKDGITHSKEVFEYEFYKK